MKKTLTTIALLIASLFFCQAILAQGYTASKTAASPKPPEVVAKKIQTEKVTYPVVSPAIPEKALHSTAGLKTSQPMPKITKVDEPAQQAKANQSNPQPTSASFQRTDNLVVPKKVQNEIPDSKSPPPPVRIKE